MGFFQNLVLAGVKPLNELEASFLGFLKEEVPLERFEAELARSQVVILLKDPPPPAGAGGGLRPLVIDGAAGGPALCVFTHRDRALPYAKSMPEYAHAMETEFSFLLSFVPAGTGMVFNAGTRFSTEVDAEGVDAMRPGP